MTFTEFQTPEEAKDYLAKNCKDVTHKKLMTKESNLIKKYQDDASDILVMDLLKAPNMFVASAMMKQNKMFYGRGDFAKAIKALGTAHDPSFKDIGNKLVILKTGFLYHIDEIADINEEDDNKGIRIIKEKKTDQIPKKKALPLFADSNVFKRACDHGINYKQVFQVWAKNVYGRDNQEEEKKQEEEVKGETEID